MQNKGITLSHYLVFLQIHKPLLKIYDEDIIHTASGGANDHFFDYCAGIALKLENPCYPLQQTVGNIFRA